MTWSFVLYNSGSPLLGMIPGSGIKWVNSEYTICLEYISTCYSKERMRMLAGGVKLCKAKEKTEYIDSNVCC